MRVDVVGIGTVVVDHLVVLPGTPDRDTKTTVIEDCFQVGGPVPTALAALRRYGWRCSFIGAWADDPLGHMIESDLQREDIDYGMSAARKAARTGFAHVWVDQRTGSRTIACHRPCDVLGQAPLDEVVLRQARVLHLDGWSVSTAIKAARIVRQQGGTVVLDTGSPKPGMTELLRHVDVVNCPRRFINQFFETDDLRRGTAQLLTMGPRMVTATSGDTGALIATAEGTQSLPAFEVDAVDTTGAGDTFCGGLIHGLLSGWTPDRILPFAMAAAAAKCRRIGNRDALPTLVEVHELMAVRMPAPQAPRQLRLVVPEARPGRPA